MPTKAMIDKLILDITNRPGIYKFLDQNAKIIYIGKALKFKKKSLIVF